jgi:ribosomal protein L37AE/L43A
MRARQKSCHNEKGKLLYPSIWICSKCLTEYDGKSLAEYCCDTGEEGRRRNEDK